MMTKGIFQALSLSSAPPSPPHFSSFILSSFQHSHFQTLCPSIVVSLFSLLPQHSLPLFLYLSVSSAGGLTNYSPLFLLPSLLSRHSAEDTWLNPAGHLCVHLFSLSLHPSLRSALALWLSDFTTGADILLFN